MINLTAKQAAERLGVDPSRVRVLCRSGRLGRKFGHIWLITDADVAAYLKAGPKPAGRPVKL